LTEEDHGFIGLVGGGGRYGAEVGGRWTCADDWPRPAVEACGESGILGLKGCGGGSGGGGLWPGWPD